MRGDTVLHVGILACGTDGPDVKRAHITVDSKP